MGSSSRSVPRGFYPSCRGRRIMIFIIAKMWAILLEVCICGIPLWGLMRFISSNFKRISKRDYI